jgi:hypothetical protein
LICDWIANQPRRIDLAECAAVAVVANEICRLGLVGLSFWLPSAYFADSFYLGLALSTVVGLLALFKFCHSRPAYRN